MEKKVYSFKSIISRIIFIYSFLILISSKAQYVESFNTIDRGILLGTCTGALGTSCAINNFSGVNWKIGGVPIPSTTIAGVGMNIPNPIGLEGIDNGDDYFKTIAGGKLGCIDIDGEAYWESPVLNIGAAGAITLAVDLEWDGLDGTPTAAFGSQHCAAGFGLDYIKVQYSVNGGAFATIPSIAGSSNCATVGYLFPADVIPASGTGTATATGITGTTLVIRVLVSTNSSGDIVRIAEVRVPTAGVTLNCSQPVLSSTVKNIVCNGPNSGSIDLTASGGAGGYIYNWGAGQPTTQDRTGLATGTYTVIVTDAAGCSQTTSATIISTPMTQTGVISASYCGLSNGTVDLFPNGGNQGYTYSWSNGATSQDLNGVLPNTYTVTITDSSVPTCTSIAPYIIGTSANGPYLETFSIPNKGNLINQVNDFLGMKWTLSSWTFDEPPAGIGRDNGDYFQTNPAGKLEVVDTDQEVCWLSPEINISNSGTIQFSVDLAWTGYDNEDYILVQYSINGGAFTTIPNVFGGGAGTIQYPFPTVDLSNSTTVTKTGIMGNKLQIRICINANSQGDVTTIDNVSIPQTISLCFCPNLVVVNPSTLTGTTGTPFSQSFTSTGANSSVTYSTSSTLPMGLTLSSSGLLSGNPSQGGLFPIVVSAKDAFDCSKLGNTYNLQINTALPVSLILFEVKKLEEFNLLKWKVASEKNFRHYEIERSSDSKAFEIIGRVNGAGNTKENLSYIFKDVSVKNKASTNYYRLIMNDLDGTQKRSNIIAIDRESTYLSIQNAYPNPVDNLLRVDFTTAKSTETQLIVFDFTGKVVYKNKIDTQSGLNSKEITVKNWPSGTYFIKINDGNSLVIKKIVKQ